MVECQDLVFHWDSSLFFDGLFDFGKAIVEISANRKGLVTVGDKHTSGNADGRSLLFAVFGFHGAGEILKREAGLRGVKGFEGILFRTVHLEEYDGWFLFDAAVIA